VGFTTLGGGLVSDTAYGRLPCCPVLSIGFSQLTQRRVLGGGGGVRDRSRRTHQPISLAKDLGVNARAQMVHRHLGPVNANARGRPALLCTRSSVSCLTRHQNIGCGATSYNLRSSALLRSSEVTRSSAPNLALQNVLGAGARSLHR